MTPLCSSLFLPKTEPSILNRKDSAPLKTVSPTSMGGAEAPHDVAELKPHGQQINESADQTRCRARFRQPEV